MRYPFVTQVTISVLMTVCYCKEMMYDIVMWPLMIMAIVLLHMYLNAAMIAGRTKDGLHKVKDSWFFITNPDLVNVS